MSYVRTEAQRQAGRNVAAANTEALRAQRLAWVEDIADMVSTGAGVHEIADRLGYRNIDSILRRLRRAGRHDLSNLLRPRKRVA